MVQSAGKLTSGYYTIAWILELIFQAYLNSRASSPVHDSQAINVMIPLGFLRSTWQIRHSEHWPASMQGIDFNFRAQYKGSFAITIQTSRKRLQSTVQLRLSLFLELLSTVCITNVLYTLAVSFLLSQQNLVPSVQTAVYLRRSWLSQLVSSDGIWILVSFASVIVCLS